MAKDLGSNGDGVVPEDWGGTDGSPLQDSAFMRVRDPGLHPGLEYAAPSGLGSVRLLSVLRKSSALPVSRKSSVLRMLSAFPPRLKAGGPYVS